ANGYGLFKYPDYTLPFSVKIAEIAQERRLDVLHVHYAVPHATAALLARDMLPSNRRPKIVTTLHGTDTILFGRDPSYGPAIRHVLEQSDAVTTVSEFLGQETQRLLDPGRPIEVIHNFFEPRAPVRPCEDVRRELGLRDSEALILHLSNLRPLKRIDRMLEAIARVRRTDSFKLVILAGGDFGPYHPLVERLGLAERIVIRERVSDIEDYLEAADLGLFTSDIESFCLSILECMAFATPVVATAVGGIPEVVEPGRTGLLVSADDRAPDTLARAIEKLLADHARRAAMGAAAQARARKNFSAAAIIPRYQELYRRVCSASPRNQRAFGITKIKKTVDSLLC